jgi:hypothetical protein
VCGEAGESQRTVNPLPLVELVRIHPHPPFIIFMKSNTDSENKTPLFIEAISWVILLSFTAVITYAAFFTAVNQ